MEILIIAFCVLAFLSFCGAFTIFLEGDLGTAGVCGLAVLILSFGAAVCLEEHRELTAAEPKCAPCEVQECETPNPLNYNPKEECLLLSVETLE